MKKYFNLIVALVVMLFAGNSFAFTPPPAPAQGWYVSDQTGKLTTEQVASLNQKIEQVSKTTKNEFGILFLNDMGGDNIEDVAYTTFNSWGIGKRGLDNGCLIVVALTERKSRIETGKGVGGEVTDVQALNILKTKLNPHLKTGDFAGGFHATLDELGSLIESRHNQKALVVSNPSSSSTASCALAAAGVGADSGGGSSLVLVFLLAVSGLVVALLVRRSARRKQKTLDDAVALAAAELDRQQRDRVKAENARKELERHRAVVSIPVPRVPRPAPPLPRTVAPKPAVSKPIPTVSNPVNNTVVAAAAVGVTAGVLAAEAERRLKDQESKVRAEREEESRRRRQRDEDDRRRREQDDEDRRRRQRDDDARSSSSSSSFDFGGGSSSGGGFDGGSSGGGGGSSDW